jgi:hypothetical protein
VAVVPYEGVGANLGVRAKPRRACTTRIRRCRRVQGGDSSGLGMTGGSRLSAAAGGGGQQGPHWADCCAGLRPAASEGELGRAKTRQAGRGMLSDCGEELRRR